MAPTTSNLGAIDPYWHSYEYSPSGNRLQWTERFRASSTIETRIHDYDYPAPTAAQPHALEQVTTSGYQPGAESFDYDNTGALIERDQGSGQGLDLHYDAEQRLIAATDKDTGDLTEFIYDANGVRLIKIDESTDTTTLYIGGAEYARNDTTGTITPTRHYSLGGEAIAIRKTAGIGLRHIVADTQGTGTLQIDIVTKTYEKRRYAPFGFERNNEDPPDWHGDRGFLNKTEDASWGTTHLDAREYDPRHARFTTPDPLLAPYEPQHLNPYTYGFNNPLTYTDPDGLFPRPCLSCVAGSMKSKSISDEPGWGGSSPGRGVSNAQFQSLSTKLTGSSYSGAANDCVSGGILCFYALFGFTEPSPQVSDSDRLMELVNPLWFLGDRNYSIVPLKSRAAREDDMYSQWEALGGRTPNATGELVMVDLEVRGGGSFNRNLWDSVGIATAVDTCMENYNVDCQIAMNSVGMGMVTGGTCALVARTPGCYSLAAGAVFTYTAAATAVAQFFGVRR